VARILIIDDEEALRRMLRQALERAGYEVREAKDGREGLHQSRTVAVDLILADVFIADQDGLATIAILRRELPAVKIIVMSGGDRIGNLDIAEAIRPLGIHGMLKKPFELHELLETVQDVLQ
jgi:two-component system KDP operon response regulator KdpE